MYTLECKSSFAGAHFLRDYQGKCERLHGHNWTVFVRVKGNTLQANGLLIDFKTLKLAVQTILTKFDHQNLNEVEPFDQINPSCELIAQHLFHELEGFLETHPEVTIDRVKIYETENNAAIYCKT